nr:BamA/TamA family outer membrane protein [Ancylomarina sp. 16SWW S1-10-2]
MLQALNQYKFVNIRFEVDTDSENAKEGNLNCFVQLSPFKKQSYVIEVEGTNSSGNIGFAGKLNYQHKNLLRGAEVLDVRFSSATESVRSNDNKNFFSREYGGEISLSTPKFILPFFNANGFRKKYNPTSKLSLSYSYQKRPDYVRTQADASFGYNWKSSKYLTHKLNLIELSFVEVNNLSQDFIDDITNLYIANSFTDHIISTTRYSLVYNNQNLNKLGSYSYLRFNFETAGNTLKAIDQLLGSKKNYDYDDNGELEGTYYDLLGIRYAQYLKVDIDYRYNKYFNRANSLVGRFFMGLGYAYDNLEVLPFEKSYFSGGANGIRAWQVRSLGPGSYSNDEAVYPNNTADFKLEGNLEYRFKLIWKFEGAMFLDAGNIWAISPKDNRVGAKLTMKDFYKEIAIGTGIGTRVDLNFILFRLDLGLKLRDPSLATDKRWIIGNRAFKFSQLTYNIGIGYPF